MAISLLSNLKINMKAQNVERDAFDTIADMKAFSENYLPPIFDAYCYEDGRKYRYNASNEIDETTGKWRVIGEGGSSDLSSYYTKTQTNNLLDEKVDKDLGKGLSTNDYSDSEVARVDANESAITTLNGNSSVVGSVDYKVANGVIEANTYTDTECAKKVDKVSGKQLSTEDYTSEEKTKLASLENYDDTALANRVTANEDAITVLNGDTTVNGSVDKKVASCLSDSKDYTDVSIQNAIRQTAIVCDAKPTLSGTTITYYQGGVEKTVTSDNKTKFYYTSSGTNYSTIFIEGTEFTDTIASVNFSDYVSKQNDVVNTYTGSEADKTKIPSIGSLDALKALVDTDLADKFDTADIESSVSSSSDNPVSSSALYNKFAEKVDIAQGVANEGKVLQVNDSGNLALVDPQSTIDFSDTVSKTNDLVSTYTGSEVDKTKVPTLASMDALKALVDTDVNGKVSTAQGVANEGKILQVDSSGDLALVDVSAMGGDASDISYTNASYPTYTNVNIALSAILDQINYVEPQILTFIMAPATDTYEIGSTVNEVVFNWTYNKDGITSQTLTDCTLADETVRTATYSTPITSNKTFTLTASDSSKSVSASKSISFKHYIYWGASTEPISGDYDSSFILNLASKRFATNTKGTFSATLGSGEFLYLAYPSSWGQVNSWWISGFEVTTEQIGTLAFTNASGNTTTFRITRSTKSGLGSITAEVK